MLQILRRLFRWRQPPAGIKRPEGSADEMAQERDLLERVAAGIALNKTPGR
jgi:hypothetical protein